MLPYIAEFLGTMILIILGDGVVANVNLNKSGMKGASAVSTSALHSVPPLRSPAAAAAVPPN